jgi:hypothetical protein
VETFFTEYQVSGEKERKGVRVHSRFLLVLKIYGKEGIGIGGVEMSSRFLLVSETPLVLGCILKPGRFLQVLELSKDSKLMLIERAIRSSIHIL